MIRKLLLLTLCSCLLSCELDDPLYTSQSYVFGTLVDISIYGEPKAEAEMIASSIMREFQNLNNRLHAWKPSELNGINRSIANGESKLIKPDIAQIIQQAKEYSIQSDGLFNPAIGQLISTWGFQNDEFHPIQVNDEKVSKLVLSNPQMTDISIEKGRLSSSNPNVKLDLGGYAKGYALDLAVKKLKKQAVHNVLINIGGNVIAIGSHGKKPWRVGIQHPRKPNPIAALDLPSGWAIGTSGDYQRYFMLNGKRYCHIIDPRTGYPAQGTQSVTVLIPPQDNTGVLSDVASKPIFIADINNKQRMAHKMGIDNFMVIMDNGDILISAAMLKRIDWLDADAKKHVKVIQ
jgi:FAD:protein FMN transferase